MPPMPPTDPATLPGPPTADLTRVRRAPERGVADRVVIDAILDAGSLCHLGYLHVDPASEVPAVRPVVVPTLYARDGDDLVLHGSSASRAMRAGAGGVDDEPRDLDLDVWAGVVPIGSTFGTPIAEADVASHLAPPVWNAPRVRDAPPGAAIPTGTPLAPRAAAPSRR